MVFSNFYYSSSLMYFIALFYRTILILLHSHGRRKIVLKLCFILLNYYLAKLFRKASIYVHVRQCQKGGFIFFF